MAGVCVFLNIGYVGAEATSFTMTYIFNRWDRFLGWPMKKLDERTAANMEVALEQVCRALPHGGDHETRKRVARKLLHSARHGNTTLGDFVTVARAALSEISVKKSA